MFKLSLSATKLFFIVVALLKIGTSAASSPENNTIAPRFGNESSLDVQTGETGKTPLYVGGFFPLSNHWWINYSPLFPLLIQTAFDEIANSTDILPGYHLKLLSKDTMGQPGLAIKRLVEFIEEPPTKLMLIGPALSDVAAAVAQAVQHWNLYQVLFSTRSSVFNDRKRYPNVYQVNYAARELNPSKVALMKQFGWSRCATLTTDSEVYVSAMNAMHNDLAENNFTLLTSGVIQNDEVRVHVQRLKQYEARIIFASVTQLHLVPMFCEAHRLGMYGRNHVWVLDGFRATYRWRETLFDETDCSLEDLMRASAGALVVDHPYSRQDDEPTVSGKTSAEYQEWIANFDIPEGLVRFPRTHPWTYDAAWTIALALNKTAAELPAGMSLEDFNYTSSELTRLLEHNLRTLEFEGVSGPVYFTEDGSRSGIVYIAQDPEVGERRDVGSFDSRKGFSWNPDSPVLWADGEPPKDRFEHIVVKHWLNRSAFAAFGVAASAGLLLATTFLVFNIAFRKKRLIKMSSPNINNMIILGTMLTFLSVFLYGLGPEDTSVNVCMGKIWLSSLGFTIGFGAMFSKTWRVHTIFKNTSLKKKIVKDLQLVGIVVVFMVVDLVLLLPWSIWQPQQWETRTEVETSDDVVYMHEYNTCFHENQYYWFGALYIYKGLLLVFGVFLAWETRRITIPALNDSKYIGFAVYNIVVACVFGVPVSHVLSYDQINIRFCVVALMMTFCTTVTLCLVFVPKVKLARSPENNEKVMFTGGGGTNSFHVRPSAASRSVAPVSTGSGAGSRSAVSECGLQVNAIADKLQAKVKLLEEQLHSEKEASENLCSQVRQRYKTITISRQGATYRVVWP